MRWASDDRREVFVALANAEIPCTEVEEGFLGDSAVECNSTPWTLRIDGVDAMTTPVTCWSGHDGLFGYIDKRCEGGQAVMTLPDGAGEDVEIVAATEGDENRITLRGARRTYTLVEEVGFDHGQPGIVRVDDLELVSDVFTAIYTQAGTALERDVARRVFDDTSRLELSPYALENGDYDVRVLALAKRDGATIAVPIAGSITVGP